MKPQRILVVSLATAVALAVTLTGCGPAPSPTPEAGGNAQSPPPPPAQPPAPPRQLIADAWKASWAPDGQRLAIGRGPGQGIEIYDLGTQTRTPLTPTGKDPAWSPDGRLIAHVREPEHNAYQAEETWVIAPDGTGARRVGTGGFPAWSADGKLLIVHERTRNRMVAYQAARLETEPTVYCERALSWYPGVSPDGTNIAFGIAGQLVVVDRTSGRQVASWPTPNDGGLLPAWSPDGKLVAFGGFDSSQLGLCVFEVATGKAARIAAGNFTMPAWSADGRRMAFDNRAGDREVWVVDRDFVDARLRDPAAALSRTAAPTPEAPAERPADTTSLQGQPAPGFELDTITGEKVRLADLKGSTVVLDFWATWCPPCRKSLPHLQKVAEDAGLKERGLRVFAVNLREDRLVAKKFLDENRYTFAVPLDADGSVSEKFRVQGIPTTIIIDKQGVIRTALVGFGPGSEAGLDRAIHDALGEK